MKLVLFPCLALTSLAVLDLAGWAGTGGCAPESNTYTFFRGDHPDESDPVGSGKFGGDTVLLFPGTPQETEWTQDPSTGQYKPTPPDGRGVCFTDGTPITYEYKFDDVPIRGSGGWLSP